METYLRSILRITAITILWLLILAAVRELATLLVASALSNLAEIPGLRGLLECLPFSANRLWILVTTLSQIHPGGESAPLARFATQATIETIMVCLGTTLIAVGRNLRRNGKATQKKLDLIIVFGGILALSQAVLSIFSLPLSPRILEEMGFGFLIGPFVEGRPQEYQTLLSETVPLVIRLVLVTFGFVLWILIWWIRTVGRSAGGKGHGRSIAQPVKGLMTIIGVSLLLVLLTQPYDARTQQPKIESEKEKPPTAVYGLQSPTPEPPRTTAPSPTATPSSGRPKDKRVSGPYAVFSRPALPTSVRIERPNGEIQLVIDGQPVQLRGVHYFFGDLVKEPRERRMIVLRRDLSIIQQVGFTVVTGWEESGFDGDFLRLAQELKLWVIQPIPLHPGESFPPEWNPLSDGDFLDPTFRTQVKETVRRKIKLGKNAPALLLWNIGADEPLEKMTNHYHRPKVQVQAAADLIVELAEMVQEVDPAHPIITSEPQDWYLDNYQPALDKVRTSEKDPSRFFILGANFYGHPRAVATDLKRVKKGVAEKLQVLFAVTEWAPFGVDRKDQPRARVRLAKDTAAVSPISLAYVFNPAADPLNPWAADPTQAIVTGLALTDIDRNDSDGSLTALADNWERPLFPASLRFIKADEKTGGRGIPPARPVRSGTTVEQTFVAVKPDGKSAAYRWVYNERTDSLFGPEITQQVSAETRNGVRELRDTFLQAYLELGGPEKFGLPTTDSYETVYLGKKVFRQDFSQGWSLVSEIP